MSTGVEQTHVAHIEYDAWDECSWASWKCAAAVSSPPEIPRGGCGEQCDGQTSAGGEIATGVVGGVGFWDFRVC
jgi:hypothetical protein